MKASHHGWKMKLEAWSEFPVLGGTCFYQLVYDFPWPCARQKKGMNNYLIQVHNKRSPSIPWYINFTRSIWCIFCDFRRGWNRYRQYAYCSAAIVEIAGSIIKGLQFDQKITSRLHIGEHLNWSLNIAYYQTSTFIETVIFFFYILLIIFDLD